MTVAPAQAVRRVQRTVTAARARRFAVAIAVGVLAAGLWAALLLLLAAAWGARGGPFDAVVSVVVLPAKSRQGRGRP